MAYGRICPICGGRVDNNEYDYTKDMCKDCAYEQDLEEIKHEQMTKLMNSDCEQMVLEV